MNLWYNLAVPAKVEKKDEPLAMKVTESTLRTIAKIAEVEDRPIGYVARELMIRGLALYKKDGRLRDGLKTQRVPVDKEAEA
jgi:hypothetical protein